MLNSWPAVAQTGTRHLQTSAHLSDLTLATDVAQRRCSTRILVL